MNFFV